MRPSRSGTAFRLLAVAASACLTRGPSAEGTGSETGRAASSTTTPQWVAEAGPPLPDPVANNAVAASTVDGRDLIFTFLGLGAGKDFRAITTRAHALDVKSGRWAQLPDVPGSGGRLAATAQALGHRVYVFGGYSVAADGKETTSPAVDIYDVREGRYSRGADMPIPVDDTVSGVWRDRLIFLVSGWSSSNNVAGVQIYDPTQDRWARATPIPGTPVFGHAGGIAGDVIVYCGGARVHAPKSPKYVPNAECYRGDIDPADPTRVAWRLIVHHPGSARYRAAAGPVQTGDVVGVMFVGGTSNPYNYDGVGYDGRPSEPEASSLFYDITRDGWVEVPHLATASMDHRGLVAIGGAWWTVGGFGAGQTVVPRVTRFMVARSR